MACWRVMSSCRSFFCVPYFGVHQREGGAQFRVVEVVRGQLDGLVFELREFLALRQLVERGVHGIEHVARGNVDRAAAACFGIGADNAGGGHKIGARFLQGHHAAFQLEILPRDGLVPVKPFVDVGVQPGFLRKGAAAE